MTVKTHLPAIPARHNRSPFRKTSKALIVQQSYPGCRSGEEDEIRDRSVHSQAALDIHLRLLFHVQPELVQAMNAVVQDSIIEVLAGYRVPVPGIVPQAAF